MSRNKCVAGAVTMGNRSSSVGKKQTSNGVNGTAKATSTGDGKLQLQAAAENGNETAATMTTGEASDQRPSLNLKMYRSFSNTDKVRNCHDHIWVFVVVRLRRTHCVIAARYWIWVLGTPVSHAERLNQSRCRLDSGGRLVWARETIRPIR